VRPRSANKDLNADPFITGFIARWNMAFQAKSARSAGRAATAGSTLRVR
jgi:hypothetical protein